MVRELGEGIDLFRLEGPGHEHDFSAAKHGRREPRRLVGNNRAAA
jgi:hypothetical protein